MNQPAPQPTKQPTVKGRGGPIAVSALAAVLVGVLALHEGDVRTPYRDQGGIWTVCKGITGPDVIPGKTYTDADCERLETTFAAKMFARIDGCIKTPLNFNEWIAYGHFTYNLGTRAFCDSTLVKLLNAGDRHGACKQMARWTWTRVGNKKVNCRLPGTKCGGIPKRRDYEVRMCLDAIGDNS